MLHRSAYDHCWGKLIPEASFKRLDAVQAGLTLPGATAMAVFRDKGTWPLLMLRLFVSMPLAALEDEAVDGRRQAITTRDI